MDLINRKILDLPNNIINISGDWIDNKTPKWEGQAHSEEPIIAISFFEYDNKIEWIKSKKSNDIFQKILINIFNYDKYGLDIQFNYNIGNSGLYYRSKIETINYLPNINTGNVKSGIISLLCSFNGNPKLNLYVAFLPSKTVQVGRNGIWHIKKSYIENIENEFIDILLYGRKGFL
jgi:hypothetical protein